ncbi:bifunctional transcriptional activator/DNA repair enzyme AdaA [Litorimonas sp. RW-G-Af-16]|uniref:bifunctional transcriptional activator/DNA repair enzyme AdaA n=1 Tax=Litorimonas sp. RW-G-Af-16 TaxID=3241168 RepID=UPI00390CAC2A
MDTLDHETCYKILVERDTRYADHFFVGVLSTQIFCRPGCPARTPKPENCMFYPSAEAALQAGFRACKRCHPAHASGEASDLVKKLIALVESQPDQRWTKNDLQNLGIDPSTARRQFQRCFGMSFSAYARARRLASAAKTLQKGDPVIQAQLEAGYASASGFREAFTKTFGTAPQNANPDPLLIDWLPTPMGQMLAVADASHLYMLEFTERKNMTQQFSKLRKVQRRAVLPGRTKIHDQIAAELNLYFKGDLESFQTPIATTGTEFQSRTWAQLQAIPIGETRSYAELANMVGDPKAVRAVAGANSKNGLAIVIPCHRVIGSDGSLGGYAGGVSRKADLLAHERNPKTK